MRIQFLTTKTLFQLLLVAMCTMTMATAVEAKSSKKDRVMILEVKINSSTGGSVCGFESLTITGTGFANKDFPIVFLGNQGDQELGDLFVCGEPSDTVIDVLCPSDGGDPVCPPGDYRLEVFTKKGGKSFKKSSKSSNHFDSYDLTIGGGGGSGGDPGFLRVYPKQQTFVSTGTFFVTASCDDGDVAVGGGFECGGEVDNSLLRCRATTILSSRRTLGDEASWTVTADHEAPPVPDDGPPFPPASLLSVPITAHVVCLELPNSD